MEITTVYQKEWQDFGRPVNTFAMSDVTVLDEFLPDPPLKDQHIERNPTILDIQAIPEMSEAYVRAPAAPRAPAPPQKKMRRPSAEAAVLCCVN